MTHATTTEARPVLPPGDELMTFAEVARVCKVSPSLPRLWAKGIRVGGTRVRLSVHVTGSRSKVSPTQLKEFLDACHRAKFGDDPAPRVETPAQRQRRFAADKQRAARALA